MLCLTILFTSLVLSFAAAQSNTTFDPNSVDLTTRNQWCNGETANCPTLCGGLAFTKHNTCVGSSLLQYQCTCDNGTSPSNIDQYQGTVPNFICEQTFAQCRIANPGSSACKTCGTLMPSNVPASTSSASAAASSSTGTATTTSASTTASAKSGAGKVEAIGGVIGGAIGLAAVIL